MGNVGEAAIDEAVDVDASIGEATDVAFDE